MPSGFNVSATFSKAFASNAFPFFSDLREGYYYGPDAASSQANRKAGSAFPTASLSATVPTYGTNYADIGNSTGKYFDTGDAYFGPVTLIAVIDAGATASRFPIGNVGATNNIILSISSGKAVNVFVDNSQRSTGTVVHAGTASDWAFVGLTYSLSAWKAFHKTSGAYSSESGSFSTAGSAWTNMRVGGISSAQATKVAAAAVYGRVLNDTEIAKVYTVVAANLSKRGITTLL